MKTKVIIDDLGKREDRPEYPIKALREAITNALIHRDYSSYTEGAYISVYMYEDRIEIISPGALYGANKFSNLETEKIMDSRNPTIVRILEDKTDILENRHTGITTMKRELERYGMPAPTFVDGTNYFKVTFRKVEESAPQIEESAPQVEKNTPAQQSHKRLSNEDGKKIVLNFCIQSKDINEICEHLNIKSKKYVSRAIIKPLIEERKLDYTNHNIVNAKNQKYITVQTKEKE